MPKIAAINAAVSWYNVERAPRRINLQTFICLPEKRHPRIKLLRHLYCSPIWWRDKSPNLPYTDLTPKNPWAVIWVRLSGGIQKKSIRQTERRGGKNVIDWDKDLGCLAVLNLSLPLTSSTLCLHLFLPSAWLLLSLLLHLIPLCSQQNISSAFCLAICSSSDKLSLVLSLWKEDGGGRQSNIHRSV